MHGHGITQSMHSPWPTACQSSRPASVSLHDRKCHLLGLTALKGKAAYDEHASPEPKEEHQEHNIPAFPAMHYTLHRIDKEAKV